MKPYRFTEIIAHAMKLHDGQYRKDKVTPYIAHPIAAAIVLAKAGCDDEQITAGLLHDTVEDTDYTEEELRRDYGDRIADMVMACSEDKSEPDWQKRKDDLLTRLRTVDDAKIVKAADTYSNMIDFLDSVKEDENFWVKFGTSKAQRMGYYTGVYEIGRDFMPEWMRKTYKETLDKLGTYGSD